MTKIIAKRYSVIGEIGSGAMGTVYKGFDTQTQQQVAIKQLKSKLTNDELIERFKREGEALRDLDHPNIVKMLGAIQEEDNHYLIMEYISGGDLSDLLKKGQLPLKRVLNIAIDLADALTRAHRLKIVHRDLKPANILITEDGILKLTDFGVAHIGTKERVTVTESVIGTIEYLAPEALAGGEVDVRTDIWAFGVILYEMLTREHPFAGETVSQVIMTILQQMPADLEKIRSDIPIVLIDLIYRMLEKDPQMRIASVRLVGAELEALLQGSSTESRSNLIAADAHPPRFAIATTTGPAVRHNLPAQTTPFVGREAELAELARLIENPNNRLITIVAPGGMGKTRLSLQAAELQVDVFTDGVQFVEFAPIAEADGTIPAIATALNYQFQADGRDEKKQILDYLSAKNLLLILDNWEHILDGASLVTDILKVAGDVKIIATSRQRLSQPGEILFQLSGMDFPQWETPEDAMEYAAMKLFMNSAIRAQPNFELTVDNLNIVARICRLVEGMPLGIVLATAWLSILSLDEIAEEIQQGIDILEDEGAVVPERQRSIRAVFEYSWQQMTPNEQEIFMQMSIFRGGFTREAVQEITGASLRQLMSMSNKSLIRRDSVSGRYHIHELLRQYAHGHLKKSGSVDVVLNRHASYYLGFLAEKINALKGDSQLASLNEIESNFDNINLAWHTGLANRDSEGINNAIEAVELFCMMRSRVHDGRILFKQARQTFSNIQDEQQSYLAHRLRIRLQDINITPTMLKGYLKEALQASVSRSDEYETAYCHVKLGEIAHNVDQNPQLAIEHFEAGSRLYRQLGDSYYLGDVLSRLGESYQMMGDFEKTGALVHESYQLQQQSGDEYGQSKSLRALSMFDFMAGDFESGGFINQQSYDLYRRMKNLAGQAETLLFVGWLKYASGEIEHGYQDVEQALQIATDIRLASTQSWTLAFLSMVDSYNGKLENAKKKLDQSRSIETNPFQQTGAGDVWLQTFIVWSQAVYLVASGDYQKAKSVFRSAWEFAYQSYSYGFLISFMPVVAILYAQENQKERVAEIIGLLSSVDPKGTIWLSSWALFDDLNDRIKQELGEDTFQNLYQQGASKDAVALAGEILSNLWDVE